MNNLISVIIPVYNHAHTLSRCFASLAKQTYKPIEIIVVNDGSTDDFDFSMNEILASPWGKSLNTKIIHQANKGAPVARNAGLKLAQGEYVIFWDADTVADKGMLAAMAQMLEQNLSVSYVYCAFRFGFKTIKTIPFSAEKLRANNYIDTTSLVRRADLPAAGWDEKLKRFMDWDLWLTMLENNKTGLMLPGIWYKKIIYGRKGYSNWLPKIIYRLPFKGRKVRKYEQAQQVVKDKHNLK